MRSIQIACLALLACLPAFAAENTRSYLCIADQATGFSYDKNTKKWISGKFNVEDMRYIFKRDPRPTASNRWAVFEFGARDGDVPNITCDEDFNEAQVIVCQQFHYFRFDRESSRFMLIYLAGYTPANRFGTEAENTPFMAIGKCSAI